MKKKHHTPQQIIDKLRTVERLRAEGATVAEAAKQIEVSEQTYYRWRLWVRQDGQAAAPAAQGAGKRNARLKKLVAEQSLDIDILEETLKGKY